MSIDYQSSHYSSSQGINSSIGQSDKNSKFSDSVQSLRSGSEKFQSQESLVSLFEGSKNSDGNNSSVQEQDLGQSQISGRTQSDNSERSLSMIRSRTSKMNKSMDRESSVQSFSQRNSISDTSSKFSGSQMDSVNDANSQLTAPMSSQSTLNRVETGASKKTQNFRVLTQDNQSKFSDQHDSTHQSLTSQGSRMSIALEPSLASSSSKSQIMSQNSSIQPSQNESLGKISQSRENYGDLENSEEQEFHHQEDQKPSQSEHREKLQDNLNLQTKSRTLCREVDSHKLKFSQSLPFEPKMESKQILNGPLVTEELQTSSSHKEEQQPLKLKPHTFNQTTISLPEVKTTKISLPNPIRLEPQIQPQITEHLQSAKPQLLPSFQPLAVKNFEIKQKAAQNPKKFEVSTPQLSEKNQAPKPTVTSFTVSKGDLKLNSEKPQLKSMVQTLPSLNSLNFQLPQKPMIISGATGPKSYQFQPQNDPNKDENDLGQKYWKNRQEAKNIVQSELLKFTTKPSECLGKQSLDQKPKKLSKTPPLNLASLSIASLNGMKIQAPIQMILAQNQGPKHPLLNQPNKEETIARKTIAFKIPQIQFKPILKTQNPPQVLTHTQRQIITEILPSDSQVRIEVPTTIVSESKPKRINKAEFDEEKNQYLRQKAEKNHDYEIDQIKNFLTSIQPYNMKSSNDIIRLLFELEVKLILSQRLALKKKNINLQLRSLENNCRSRSEKISLKFESMGQLLEIFSENQQNQQIFQF